MQWSNNEPAGGAGAHTGGQWVAAGMAGLPGWPKYSDMRPRPRSGTEPDKEKGNVKSIMQRLKDKEYKLTTDLLIFFFYIKLKGDVIKCQAIDSYS